MPCTFKGLETSTEETMKGQKKSKDLLIALHVLYSSRQKYTGNVLGSGTGKKLATIVQYGDQKQ